MAQKGRPAPPGPPKPGEEYRLRCRAMLRKLGATPERKLIELHYHPLWFPSTVNRPSLTRGVPATVAGAIVTDCEHFIDEESAKRLPNLYAELRALRADPDAQVRKGVELILFAYMERKGFRLEDTWV